MALATSAVSLMQLQFEALTRAMWLLYAASDVAIEKLMATSSPLDSRGRVDYMPALAGATAIRPWLAVMVVIDAYLFYRFRKAKWL